MVDYTALLSAIADVESEVTSLIVSVGDTISTAQDVSADSAIALQVLIVLKELITQIRSVVNNGLF
jgi:hypothetical protein